MATQQQIPPRETGMEADVDVELDPSTESDATYDDQVSEYTASITSDVYQYQMRHGRRYHAFREGVYMLPNDDQESERLDIHHALMRKLLDDKLFWAPLDLTTTPSPRVLDIGTGTGLWAIDFADAHPTAQVIGNDLTPGPTEVPPNVTFYVDDVEDDWSPHDKSPPFDFIHARFLAGAIRDWPALARNSFHALKPSGWVEFQDWDTLPYSPDGSLDPSSSVAQWHLSSVTARENLGFDMRPGKSLERWLRDAGFINVTPHKLRIPLGVWPKDRKLKELGAYNLLQLEAAIEAISLGTLVNADPPWSVDRIMEYVKEMRTQLRDRNMHAVYDFYVVYAQKPDTPSSTATTARTTTSTTS